jgi:hypothetical protein
MQWLVVRDKRRVEGCGIALFAMRQEKGAPGNEFARLAVEM